MDEASERPSFLSLFRFFPPIPIIAPASFVIIENIYKRSVEKDAGSSVWHRVHRFFETFLTFPCFFAIILNEMEKNVKNVAEKKKKYTNQYIFDYLRNILTTKSMEIFRTHINDTENFRSMPSVVILRYLSMCPDERVRNLVMSNQVFLERLDKISHAQFYRWCIMNIPRQSSPFIRYVK